MNLTKYIPKAVTRTAGTMTHKLGKNSPHILFGVGVASVITGTVLACRATLKADDVLTDIQKDLQIAKEKSKLLEDDGHAVAKAYAKGALKVGALYGPAAVVSGLGVACLVGSHKQLTNRNNSLVAAYAALEVGFNKYRERVREAVGQEQEEQLYRGVNQVDRKDFKGLEIDPDNIGPNSALFDQLSAQWKPDPELNQIFLNCQQNRWNQTLGARGYVFLNEVLESLDIPHRPEGQIIGWMKNSDQGDGYIDFGMMNVRNSRFAAGIEASVLLTFNCDGIIYDQI